MTRTLSGTHSKVAQDIAVAPAIGAPGVAVVAHDQRLQERPRQALATAAGVEAADQARSAGPPDAPALGAPAAGAARPRGILSS